MPVNFNDIPIKSPAEAREMAQRMFRSHSLAEHSVSKLATKIQNGQRTDLGHFYSFIDALFIDPCHEVVFPACLIIQGPTRTKVPRRCVLSNTDCIQLFNHSYHIRYLYHTALITDQTCILITLPKVPHTWEYLQVLIGTYKGDLRASDLDYVRFLEFMNFFRITENYLKFLLFDVQINLFYNKSVIPAL